MARNVARNSAQRPGSHVGRVVRGFWAGRKFSAHRHGSSLLREVSLPLYGVPVSSKVGVSFSGPAHQNLVDMVDISRDPRTMVDKVDS